MANEYAPGWMKTLATPDEIALRLRGLSDLVWLVSTSDDDVTHEALYFVHTTLNWLAAEAVAIGDRGLDEFYVDETSVEEGTAVRRREKAPTAGGAA